MVEGDDCASLKEFARAIIFFCNFFLVEGSRGSGYLCVLIKGNEKSLLEW